MGVAANRILQGEVSGDSCAVLAYCGRNPEPAMSVVVPELEGSVAANSHYGILPGSLVVAGPARPGSVSTLAGRSHQREELPMGNLTF